MSIFLKTSINTLSHGRLDFGIGAGWYEQEFLAYGYDFPDGPTRLRQLRDAVEIILKMWSDEEPVFEGKYHHVRGAINQPKGVQKPHIPLLIGGAGEQVTLKLVAQYADACNVVSTVAQMVRTTACSPPWVSPACQSSSRIPASYFPRSCPQSDPGWNFTLVDQR
jgi:alkanesulfonate monooxygenase SsuD/methylene tetrahydromethanopterin reductase-like flavin-dependent oxidoreductase (luciferase family)